MARGETDLNTQKRYRSVRMYHGIISDRRWILYDDAIDYDGNGGVNREEGTVIRDQDKRTRNGRAEGGGGWRH